MSDHSLFYHSISDYIKKHPEAAAHVSDYVADGISQALKSSLQRAADMEVALCLALSKRDRKQADRTILSKLKNWQDKSSLNWESTINSMQLSAAKGEVNE